MRTSLKFNSKPRHINNYRFIREAAVRATLHQWHKVYVTSHQGKSKLCPNSYTPLGSVADIRRTSHEDTSLSHPTVDRPRCGRNARRGSQISPSVCADDLSAKRCCRCTHCSSARRCSKGRRRGRPKRRRRGAQWRRSGRPARSCLSQSNGRCRSSRKRGGAQYGSRPAGLARRRRSVGSPRVVSMACRRRDRRRCRGGVRDGGQRRSMGGGPSFARHVLVLHRPFAHPRILGLLPLIAADGNERSASGANRT